MLLCENFARNFLYIFTQIAKQFCVVIINQGGGVAAPVGGQILSEVLPYLEVEQGNPDEIEPKIEIETPDITGKTIKEAENILKENGLELKINNEYEGIDKENIVVSRQLPQAGIQTYSGSCVYVDY